MTHWIKVAFALMLPLVLILSAAAQGTPAGTLYGYILDPDHRPVPGTRVVIQSTNSGETRDTVSNQGGLYSVPALDPGTYNIAVEKAGFKTEHQNGIVIEADHSENVLRSLCAVPPPSTYPCLGL